MMIIDPVAFGDVAFTRPSPKWVFDRTGTLVQVPANTLAVTYDPGDLTKAPYALVEPAVTNGVFSPGPVTSGWSTNGGTFENSMYPDPTGGGRASRWVMGPGNGKYIRVNGSSCRYDMGAQVYTVSMFVKPMASGGGLAFGLEAPFKQAVFDFDTMTVIGGSGTIEARALPQGGGWYRLYVTFLGDPGGNKTIIAYSQGGSSDILVFGDQIELDRLTTYAEGTRAADVIAPGAGLVYSNVPITEPNYNSTTTYAKDAVVHDPATHNTYVSLIAGNVGKPLTDTTAWAPNGVTNRWAMLDQYNNTQTSNAEEIIVVLTAQALAQGVYIGNADASDVRISCYDPNDGLVYQETKNLIISDSGSSFYNWCFKRIRKKSYAVSVQLPPYYTGLVTIALRKPGGTPKCGMCVLGPLVDVGLSQYGLSREIKDYSTVNFNFDGTSNVQKRNFAKIMDVDVLIDNAYIDSVIESLENYRQKPVAWIGAAAYGSACLFGTYTSFKSVISYPTQSAMNLQIQGTV